MLSRKVNARTWDEYALDVVIFSLLQNLISIELVGRQLDFAITEKVQDVPTAQQREKKRPESALRVRGMEKHLLR